MIYTPNSVIHLCNVPFENDYKHVLYFNTKSEQYGYFVNRSSVGLPLSQYSYIRKDSIIRVQGNVENYYNINYLFYNNSNYTDKVFYCFVTKVEYINDNTTALHIQADEWNTWIFDIKMFPSFVVREHVSDDSIGANTQPENLELGEYTVYEKINIMGNILPVYLLTLAPRPVGSKVNLSIAGSSMTGDILDTIQVGNINLSRTSGAYSTPIAIEWYSVFGTSQNPNAGVDALNTRINDLVNNGEFNRVVGITIVNSAILGIVNPLSKSNGILKLDTPYTNIDEFSVNNSLDGYMPRNNKLFTYPYNYFTLFNGVSENTQYRYENVTNLNKIQIKISVCPTPSVSALISIQDYKTSYGDNHNGVTRTFATQIPIAYNNALNNLQLHSQSEQLKLQGQQVSTRLSAVNALVAPVTSFMSGDILGGITSSVNALGNIYNSQNQLNQTIAQKTESLLAPSELKNLSQTVEIQDVITNGLPMIIKQGIKREYAEIIDKYFDMYGYAVNTVKIPNINNRPVWNYIQTQAVNISGSCGQDTLQIIKKIFDTGVTVWHNPDLIYNYSIINK